MGRILPERLRRHLRPARQSALNSIRYLQNIRLRGFDQARVPVVVYQMGKVGSRSVEYSLEQIGISPLYHTHQLNPDHVRLLNQKRKQAGKPTRDPQPILQLYDRLIESDRGSKYITLVRDPVSRNVSAFFENLGRHLEPSPYDSIPSVSDLISYFLESYEHDTPLNWFQREPKKVLGIDVYDQEFPKQKGAKEYKSGKYEMLVMKCEVEDKIKSDAISSFIGTGEVKMERRNIGEKKEYSNIYKKIKREGVGERYIQRMCGSVYTKHFYTPKEIDQIYEFWT